MNSSQQNQLEPDHSLPEGMRWKEAVQKTDELGSSDSDIRENAYSALYRLLLEEKALNAAFKEKLLLQAVSESGLFLDIGKRGEDGVFRRAFTSLLVALLLTADNREPYLTDTTYEEVLNALIRYCGQEADFRGYVKEKGWAHAAAHAADALDECARSSRTGSGGCAGILSAVQALLEHPDETYRDEEDERLATAVISLICTGKMSLADICAWLEKMKPAQGRQRADYAANANRKHFIRSLYMRLYESGRMTVKEKGAGLERLLELEKRFHLFRLQDTGNHA